MPKTGEELRDEAVVRVAEAADDTWMASALKAVEALATNRLWFTTDEVWAALEQDGLGRVREPRAMGAVMTIARSRQLVEPTSEYQKSSRPECHARPVRVWRSVKAIAA